MRGLISADLRLLVFGILCRFARRFQKAEEGLKAKSSTLAYGVSVMFSIHEAFHKTVYTQLEHGMKDVLWVFSGFEPVAWIYEVKHV